MSNKNEVLEYLIDQLRQQVSSNTYKQQCEDLAHEVQSLKNQLRDASALVAELQEDNIRKSEHISHLTGRVKELTCALDCAENEVMCLRSIVDLDLKGAIGYIRRANSAMTDTMRRQYLRKALEELGCKDAPEQSGCRKEDTQECEHEWRCVVVFGNRLGAPYCRKCGVAKPEECEHEWQFYGVGFPCMCLKCGLKK